MTKLTPDASSNKYQVLPDNHKVFENKNPGETTLATTIDGNDVNVKESQKQTDTGPHELGHTLGLEHFSKRLMTPSSNDPNRSSSIDNEYVEGIINNALNKISKSAGKGSVHETGAAPSDFSKGKITEKK